MSKQTEFKKFKVFKNVSYVETCRPNQTFHEQIQSANKIFFKNMFRTQYFKDIKNLIIDPQLDKNDLSNLKKYYNIIKGADILLYIYIPYSILWHYSKKYFHKGSRALEIYIVTKVVFNVFLISYLAFFINKKLSDPILYKHYSIMEKKWSESQKEKKIEYETVNKRF